MVEVEHYVAVFSGESVSVHSDPACGGEFSLDSGVLQSYLVVSGSGRLRVVAESLAISGIGIFRSSGNKLNLSGPGHDQDVAEIGMAGAAEMCVTEADDGLVVVLVARAVFISAGLVFPFDVMGDHICVRGQLHPSERDAGPGESVPHSGGADERIDILCVLC